MPLLQSHVLVLSFRATIARKVPSSTCQTPLGRACSGAAPGATGRLAAPPAAVANWRQLTLKRWISQRHLRYPTA
jgi:hypothetical protein